MSAAVSKRYKNRLVGGMGFVFTQAANTYVVLGIASGALLIHFNRDIYPDNRNLGAFVRKLPTSFDLAPAGRLKDGFDALGLPHKFDLPDKYRHIIEHFQQRPFTKRKGLIIGRLRTEAENDFIRGRVVRKCLEAKWKARMNRQEYFALERPSGAEWRRKIAGDGISNLCIRPWWGIRR